MSRRRRVISDPREIAGLVLATPGLAAKLAASVSEIDPRYGPVIVRSLVNLADSWPEGKTGWAIDNDGEPYPYDRP